MRNIKYEKVIFLHPTISTEKDMGNLKRLLSKVWMKKAVTFYFNKVFSIRYSIKSSPVYSKHYVTKLDICINNLTSNINRLFEPVTFQAEYERKSLHIIMKI